MIIPKHQVFWIVGNIHVGTPYAEVVRNFYRRFKKTPKAFTKAFRKAVYRHAIRCHKDNRSLVRSFNL